MRKILVPLDGTAESEAILPEALRMAVPDGEIHLLHVVPYAPLPLGMNPVGALDLSEKASGYLEKVRSSLPAGRGLDHVRSGDPADRILQVALELNIDLVAMTTHARRGMTRFALGSVAEAVVRKTELPVLLGRPEIASLGRPIRRILVPLDEFDSSQAVLDVVKPLAAGWNAELILLHVTPKVNDPAPQWAMQGTPHAGGGPEGRYQELADHLEEDHLTAWPLLTQGDAEEEILRQARDLNVDLVAMTTHGRQGLSRMLFGSVTQEVLRKIDRPILLIRPTKGAQYG